MPSHEAYRLQALASHSPHDCCQTWRNVEVFLHLRRRRVALNGEEDRFRFGGPYGFSGSGPVGVPSVPDRVDFHGVLVLVDAVDDPVGPAPRGVLAVDGFIKWLPTRCGIGARGPSIVPVAAAATLRGRFSCRLRHACLEQMTAYGRSASGPGVCGSPVMMSGAVAAQVRRGPEHCRKNRRPQSLHGIVAGRRVPRRR